MEQVKMVILRDVDGNPAMCKAIDMYPLLNEESLPITIEKVFDATTWNEASQVYYDHEGFGKYNGLFPDTYLSNGEEVPVQCV